MNKPLYVADNFDWDRDISIEELLQSVIAIKEFPNQLAKVLSTLTEEDLKQILIEPKNSITKQYQKLFNLDKVELVFEDEALNEISKKAINRKTGARGLRAIVEGVLLDAMFRIPSQKNIKSMAVSKDCILHNKPLKTILLSDKEMEEREKKKEISILPSKDKKL
jgi:ATP-dependent Clp protease ATP-binding subunit ClpX